MNFRNGQQDESQPQGTQEEPTSGHPVSTMNQEGVAQAPVVEAPPEVSPELLEEGDEPGDQPHAFAQFIRTRAAPDMMEPDSIHSSPLLPKQPQSLLELGLSKAFLTDLALKIIHYSGTPAFTQLIRRIGLGPGIVQQVISNLAEEHLVEIMSQSDLYTGNYRYRLTDRGNLRAAQALERSRYAGPCPVTAEQYNEVIRRLHEYKQELSRPRIKSVLDSMVLAPEVSDSVARALYSSKPTLLYGPSGNGKTSILEGFANGLDGVALVPYAIYAFGQTIRVFDQSVHVPIDEPDTELGVKEDNRMDRRWVLIQRPAVIMGAEMAEDSMDLAYDPAARFYQAPPHIKAQGGALIIDDFGRQRVSARDMLTRLMIPIERGSDTLSLTSGEKLTVPFSTQLLLGTNISIKKLADDSLLRRILYKVEIPNPKPQEFLEVLYRVCEEKGIRVATGALEHAVRCLYSEPGLRVRTSYARDLMEMLIESASYDGGDAVLDTNSFDRVFKMFLATEAEEEDSDSSY
ncbi:MAG TPA: hypothetical protein VFO59_04705 [Dehalococcoidia bacterium]|nr:hypothetical protein [Dehalococcoidia bacterium]